MTRSSPRRPLFPPQMSTLLSSRRLRLFVVVARHRASARLFSVVVFVYMLSRALTCGIDCPGYFSAVLTCTRAKRGWLSPPFSVRNRRVANQRFFAAASFSFKPAALLSFPRLERDRLFLLAAGEFLLQLRQSLENRMSEHYC